MNSLRLAAAGIAAICLGGALPAVAGATDYCVAPNDSCGGTKVGTFGDALDLAQVDPDADRVFLGASTYKAAVPTGFRYDNQYGSVEIIGAGRGQTILTGPDGATGAALRLQGAPGSSVQDLTILMPKNVGGGGFYGLHLNNVARRIEVIEDPDQLDSRTGVLLEQGGLMVGSTVTLSGTENTTGVRFVGSQVGTGTDVLRGSVISARRGVHSIGGGIIDRSRVTASDPGVVAEGGTTTVTNSVIRFTNGVGTGILAMSDAPATTVNVNGATVIGPDQSSSVGILAITVLQPKVSARVHVTNSIIRAAAPLAALATDYGDATITALYSDYDASGNTKQGLNAKINEGSVWNFGDAGFVDAAAGDYRLRADSPLVDRGDPDTAPGIDLDGNALVADGNGDGIARRDLGALELQPAPAGGEPPVGGEPPAGGGTAADTQAPLITGFRPTSAVFPSARGTRLRYTLSEDASVVLKVQRVVSGRRIRYRGVGTLRRSGTGGPNRTRFTGRIGRRALRPGRYRLVITATDAAGNRSAPKTTRFRITG